MIPHHHFVKPPPPPPPPFYALCIRLCFWYDHLQTLGEPYAELTHKRMDDRQKRRVHLSEIGLKSAADKFDSVFSPFHSLEISVSLLYRVRVLGG